MNCETYDFNKKHSMRKTILPALFLIFAIALLFASCKKSDENKTDNIVICDDSNVRIIYGSNASDYIVKASKNLADSIKESSSAHVIVESDWRINGKDDQSGDSDREIIILFGNTAHELSLRAYENFSGEGYSVRTENQYIIISATTEQLLAFASKKLIKNCQKDDGIIEIPKDQTVIDKETLLFKIADSREISADFVIRGSIDKNSEALVIYASQLLGKKTGNSSNVYYESEYTPSDRGQIIISISADADDLSDKTQEVRESTASIKYLSNKLYITGTDQRSLQSAISTFIGKVILNSDKRENGGIYCYFPKMSSVSYTWNYSIPAIPSCDVGENTEYDFGDCYFEFLNASETSFRCYCQMLEKMSFLVSTTHSEDDYESILLVKDNMIVNIKLLKNESRIILKIMLT